MKMICENINKCNHDWCHHYTEHEHDDFCNGNICIEFNKIFICNSIEYKGETNENEM